MPKVTIDDVAREAGVSRATVSRVMNALGSVDPTLAHRVREAAKKLDYTPSTIARGLAMGRTQTVGFVVPDLANPTFQSALQGLTRAAAADGYRVLVADTAENLREEVILAVEARRRCDALVLCAPRMPTDQLAPLLAELSPVVLINRKIPDSKVPSLRIDYAAGMRSLVRHLTDLGHRRIGYLAGPPESASNQDRIDGLRTPAPEVGDVDIVRIPCGSMLSDGFQARARIIEADVTAVIAYNDLVALGLLGAFDEAGVEVPGEISVAGVDDIPFARYASPPLTTVSVPQKELGEQAWHRLSALLGRRDPDDDVVFAPRLKVRRSTGPAKG